MYGFTLLGKPGPNVTGNATKHKMYLIYSELVFDKSFSKIYHTAYVTLNEIKTMVLQAYFQSKVSLNIYSFYC
jgi:hypothetical protein